MNSNFDDILSHKQAETLRAALARIIPEDDYPSACDSGVDVFIAGLLRNEQREIVPSYREGLDALVRESIAAYGQAFATLDASNQDAVLSLIERGQTTVDWATPPTEFFTILVNHTMDGYYGVANAESDGSYPVWEMVGFEPHWTIRAPESVP